MNTLYKALVYHRGINYAKRQIKRLVVMVQEFEPPSEAQLWLETAIDQLAAALWHYRQNNTGLARANAAAARCSLTAAKTN